MIEQRNFTDLESAPVRPVESATAVEVAASQATAQHAMSARVTADEPIKVVAAPVPVVASDEAPASASIDALVAKIEAESKA